MGDRVKERDRKGWKERRINYQSSSGRRDSPITPNLSGIYNYIMMHPLSHQVNRRSLSLALAVTPSSLFYPLVLALLFSSYPSFCLSVSSSSSSPFLSPVSKEKSGEAGLWLEGDWRGSTDQITNYWWGGWKWVSLATLSSTTATNLPLSKAMKSGQRPKIAHCVCVGQLTEETRGKVLFPHISAPFFSYCA